jgi:hypothetical protein
MMKDLQSDMWVASKSYITVHKHVRQRNVLVRFVYMKVITWAGSMTLGRS